MSLIRQLTKKVFHPAMLVVVMCIVAGLLTQLVVAEDSTPSTGQQGQDSDVNVAPASNFFDEEDEEEDDFSMTIEELDSLETLPGGLGALPDEVPENPDNPQTPEKIELGRLLYFEKRLSGDASMSCASCHNPDQGYSDALPRTIGFNQKELGRHSPTVLNAAFNTAQFWDGRAATLEEQAMGPIMAAGEMNMGSEEQMIEVLNSDPDYVKRFQEVFGESPSLENVGKAIAAFEKTIITPDSPFDRYAKGDKTALTASQKRGLILFMGKASCVGCHNGVNFSDNLYHNLGVKQEGPEKEDLGRFAVTNDPKDKYAFKTPTVRNAELTAPFMHDGSEKTLMEVVEFYDKGGEPNKPNKSPLMIPLNLTQQEKEDLVEFMKSLTGKLPEIEVPADHSVVID